MRPQGFYFQPPRQLSKGAERNTSCRSAFSQALSQTPVSFSPRALAVLAPILEDIVGWDRLRVRHFFQSDGVTIQEGIQVRTSRLTLSRWQMENSETAAAAGYLTKAPVEILRKDDDHR